MLSMSHRAPGYRLNSHVPPTPSALSSTRGLLSLTSVLGSLYPVVTVLLAHVLLHERLTGAQRLGVGVALGGVVAISLG